jgi:hypothetical protein
MTGNGYGNNRAQSDGCRLDGRAAGEFARCFSFIKGTDKAAGRCSLPNHFSASCCRSASEGRSIR